MRLSHLLVAASLIWFAASAHADIFQYYTVNAALTNGGTVNGTLTYSTSNVYRSSFAFTVDLNGADRMYDLGLTNELESPGSSAPIFTSLVFDTAKDFGGSYNEIAMLTKGDFASGALCAIDAPCDAAGDVSYFTIFNASTGQRHDFGYGSLTAGTSAAPTPEPSTFVLLGTSLFGIGQIVRRRLAK